MVTTTVQAWKDPDYRASLPAEVIASLPPHPAGPTWSILDAPQLREVLGAQQSTEDQMVSWNTVNTTPCSCGYVCTATTECPGISFCC